MTDPLSIAASVTAVVTAAIQTTRSLSDAVRRYRDRDKTLQRLQNELDDLSRILGDLNAAVSDQTSELSLLKGPVSRCEHICRDFRQCMVAFHGKTKTGIRDWTKMEFMKGTINDFMDSLSEYKSTILIALGTVNMRATRLSHHVLEEYSEMIKDTTHSLNVHLQRIDEKISLLTGERSKDSTIKIDLKDEKSVTLQCIRICEDASSYITSLANREPLLSPQLSPGPVTDDHSPFEAQLLMRKTLINHQAGLVATVGRLRTRLEALPQDGDSSDAQRARLQEDIDTSRQCLEVCAMASDVVSHHKVFTVGEAVATGDSDQVVINTLADLFEVRKALSQDRSAQLIASTTDETAQQMSRDRYRSRFGAFAGNEEGIDISQTTSASQVDESSPARHTRKQETGVAARQEAGYRKPHPNEMRRRTIEKDEKRARQHDSDDNL